MTNGELVDYEGDPTIEGLKSFGSMMSMSVLRPISSSEDLNDFNFKRPVALILGDAARDVQQRFLFDIACKKFNYASCGKSTVKSFIEELMDDENFSGMVLLRHADDKFSTAVFTHGESGESFATSTDELLEWMRVDAFPELVENSESNAEILFSQKRSGFSMHLVLVMSPARPVHMQVASKVATKLKGKLVTSYIDFDKVDSVEYVRNLLQDIYSTSTLPDFQASDADADAWLIHSGGKEVRFYHYDQRESFGFSGLASWVDAVLSKSITPTRVIKEEQDQQQ